MREGGHATSLLSAACWCLLLGVLLACAAATAAEAPTREGDRLVVFEPGTSDAEVDGWLAGQGCRVVYRFHALRGVWVRFDTGAVPVDAALRASPLVAQVTSDGMAVPDLVPDDPLYAQQWHLRNRAHPLVDIQAESAWDLARGDSTVVIGVIDTGVDLTHPDLAPILVPGWDCWDDDADPSPTPLAGNNYHGTYVAGVAAAVGNNGEGVAGVGWRTRVMPFKAGSGGISLFAACMAIDMCIERRVDVINCSFHFLPPDTTDLRWFVKAANDAGIVICCSAGNTEGVNIDLPGNRRFPANFNYPLVVTTSSVQSTGEPFNCYGPLTVDIAAPGSDIVSTTGPVSEHGLYFTGMGTSAATPQVAGAIALVKSRFPGCTGAFAVNRVLGRAQTSVLLQGRVAGNRRLNLYRALADPDTVAPGAITDLRLVAVHGDSATIAWTAGGEDGDTGTVDYVDLRWAVSLPIDDYNQESANWPAVPIVPLPPGSSHEFTITGLPVPGATLCVRLRDYDEQRNPGPASSLTIVIPAPQIAVTSRYVFASLLTGQRARQSVTVSNPGSVNLQVQPVPADAYPWLSVTPTSQVVPPGGQSVLNFDFDASGRCNPTQAPLLALVNLQHNGANETSPLPIQVIAALQDTCEIATNVAAVDFGEILVDSTGVRAFTVSNRGCRTLRVADVVCDAWLGASPRSFDLAPGDSQAVALTARPDHAGPFAATVIVRSDDPFRAELGIAVQGSARYPTDVPVAPAAFCLHPNQPNPFNPRTTLRFDLPAAGSVRLAIYDVAGRLIRVLVDGERPAGGHEAVWDGRDQAGRGMGSGSYFAKLESGGKQRTSRMVLVR